MALTLPIPTPSSPNSSASADSPNAPQTPLSPTHPVQTLALPPSDQAPAQTGAGAVNGANGQPKRKPSRRANTAERRATHNAVERQRRETLNGRFLDLAALLPNLSQIRRPSKSAIVNSSIAHIHSSRRHRAMASRELRLLKLEADALRRELNEWRDRASLPRVEEPVRSEAFAMVLSGEVEILTSIPGMDEQDEDDGYGDNEDDVPYGAVPASVPHPIPEEAEDVMAAPFVKAAGNPFAHNVSAPQHAGAAPLAHILPRPTSHGRPVIAQTMPNVSYENPAMASLYDAHTQAQQFQQMQYNIGQAIESDKAAAWGSQLFAAQQIQQLSSQQVQAQAHGLFPSPAASHGGPAPGTQFNQAQAQQQYFAGVPRGHVYGSPVDNEDAAPVGSMVGRGRSVSMSGSGYSGSPNSARGGSVSTTPQGSYEMPGVLAGSGVVDAFPKRLNAGASVGMWPREEMGSVPIAVGGGGGNGSGFAMMM